MPLTDKAIAYMLSTGQAFLAFVEGAERRHVKDFPVDAPEGRTDSPVRVDEFTRKFAVNVLDAVKEEGFDILRITPGVMLNDGLAMLSALLKSYRGVNRSLKSIRKNRGLAAREAGPDFYLELRRRARELGIDLMGFTRLPGNYIFKGKRVAYHNAMVCAQEMKRADIETAPSFQASMETMRVYANLGWALCELADFIRSRGIPCQVCHPLLGPVLYTSLAVKAGLGYFGRHGLVMTPQFGARQRIGALLVPLEDMPWTDSDEHRWMLDFCDGCNLCVKHCPGNAIYEQAVPNVPGIRTSADNLKCARFFSVWVGCSICVKVCPFSRKPYDKLKRVYEKREALHTIEDEFEPVGLREEEHGPH